MLRVVQFWMDLGVDGFRVDATPYLCERERTNCENLLEKHIYLRTCTSETILVANHLSDKPQDIAIGLATFTGTRPIDLFTGQELSSLNGPLWLALAPYEFRWLRLCTSPNKG